MEQRKRILVVEDRPEVLGAVSQLLEREGFRVDSVANVDGALDSIVTRDYDAVLIDFELPDGTGMTLHQEIRTVDPSLARRTLFMSGGVEAEDHLDYFDSRAGGFIRKPFRSGPLLRALNELIHVQT
ncbi:MAG: response regulator [bacterium]|nr:response regulator [bacterium]